MKIVGRLLISLAGALAVAGAAVAGCSTTNNLNNGQGTSGLGETCTRSFDCAPKLVCEQNVCLASAVTTTPDGGVIPTGDSGTVTPPGPHLGLLNESCQTSADCQSPFECIGQECSVVSYGLTATGKSCAECKTAADCCALPVGYALSPQTTQYLYAWSTSEDGGLPLAHGKDGTTGQFATPLSTVNLRCEDLLGYMGGDATICSGASNFTPNQTYLASACFLYNAYCGSCGAGGPWACNGGQCNYTASCTSVGTPTAMNAAACPYASRLRTGFNTACASPDGGPGGSCTAAAGCASDTDCAGETPSDSTSGHACSNSDAGTPNCTCYAGTSQCYFKCATDLDCAAGKACDAATHLCKTEGCATDADCVQSLRNPMGKCTAGACTVACTKDTDCSPPSTICSAGACVASGCTSDVDCTGYSAHAFCVTAPASTATYSSAVTN